MSVFKKSQSTQFLFLPNVHSCDLFSYDTLWKEEPVKPVKKKVWTVLPKFFYGLDTWVHKCNLKCHSCGDTYDSIPVSMPVRMVKDDGKIGFEVEYNYCGFLCASRATSKISNISVRTQRDIMLKLMFEYYFKVKPEEIPPAPDNSEREEYGGTMTNTEFRKIIEKRMEELLSATR